MNIRCAGRPCESHSVKEGRKGGPVGPERTECEVTKGWGNRLALDSEEAQKGTPGGKSPGKIQAQRGGFLGFPEEAVETGGQGWGGGRGRPGPDAEPQEPVWVGSYVALRPRGRCRAGEWVLPGF